MQWAATARRINRRAMREMPNRTKEGGTTPMMFLTFSLRNSMLSMSAIILLLSVAQFQLVLYQTIIGAPVRYQGSVIACLDNPSFIENDYLVRIPYGAQSVRHNNDGLSPVELVQVLHDGAL